MFVFSQLKFRTKIICLVLSGVFLTAIALFLVVSWQSSQYSYNAQQQVEGVTEINLENIVLSTYNLVDAQGEAVQQQVNNYLHVAEFVIDAYGGVQSSPENVTWLAINQESQRRTEIQLPKILVGDEWLGQNSDPGVETFVVDEIVGMLGGSATIYQRMNEAGDMLRTATNIRGTNGRRAIGTYIPAVFSNGKPNPVISTILEGKPFLGSAYEVDAWYETAYAPLFDESSSVVGMYYVGVKQENIQTLRNAIEKTRVGATGNAYILSGQSDKRASFVIAPPDRQDGQSQWNVQDASGSFVYQDMLAAALQLKPRETVRQRYLWKDVVTQELRWKVAQVAYYEPWQWVVVAEVYEDELQEYILTLQDGRTQMLQVVAFISLVIAFLIVVASIPLINSALRPLRHLTGIAQRIAAGNLGLSATVKGSDEIAEMARVFNSMTSRLRKNLLDEQEQHRKLKEVISQYAEHMAIVAQGSLTGRIDLTDLGEASEDPLVLLGIQLNETTASLQRMILQTKQSAQNLNEAAVEILADAAQRASGSAEQSAAVAQITTTVDQVRAVVRQSGESAEQVKSVSSHTLDASKEGRLAVKNTIESMERIKEQVGGIAENILLLSTQMNQIGEIIHSVDELASQSNLLALNAAVEAARAGEQGKGFSVVALEVRSLAEQSKKATAQITQILEKIQQAANRTVFATEEGIKSVDEGVILAAQARQSIELLSSVIDGSTQMANLIVVGSQQQLSGIEQIAVAIHNVHQVTQQSLESTRQAEKSAQRLADLANDMAHTVAQYEL
jgi:methyl-accepting chemotaxis protein